MTFTGARQAAFVLVLASAPAALAQVGVQGAAAAPRGGVDELAQVRLRYGVAIRNGSENDLGPGLSYAGVSPNDLALTGWWWFLVSEHLGLTLGAQREAFSLLEQDAAVTSGSLVRLNLGPTGRVRLGPVRLEAAASYSFAQLPVFGSVTTPAFSTVQRHGVLLAARGLVDLGPVTAEARFEYPLALATVGRPATSRGLGAGGALRVQLFSTGFLRWGLLADVQWHQDSLSGPAQAPLAASQRVVRVGLGLDLQWKDASPGDVQRSVSLRVSVRGEQGPLDGARFTLAAVGGPREIILNSDGTALLEGLQPGAMSGDGSAPGYEPRAFNVVVLAGETGVLSLVLTKQAPKVGALLIKVVSFDGAAPLFATVETAAGVSQTSETGQLRVEGLAPGPFSVKATAPGFNPGDEAATVVAGQLSELTITLVPEKKRVPATVRGQVRGARGGKPVQAQLEIRELKQTLQADERGAFSVQIPAGKYTIRISAAGFVSQTKTITVLDGDQAIFNVDLAPK